MRVESVRAFLAEKAPDIAIIELASSTATVQLAAEAHGVSPAGSTNSVLRINPLRMAELVGASWVDVCRD